MTARARTTKKVTASRAKPTKTTSKKREINFRNLNLIGASLLALQAILIIVLSNNQRGIEAVNAAYLAKNELASQAGGDPVTGTAFAHLFDVNLAYLVAAFLLVGAISGLVLASVYRKNYEKELANGTNRYRWIEAIFSVGLMLITTSLLIGMSDLASLLMVVGLTAIASLAGWSLEKRIAAREGGVFSGLAGLVAGLVLWVSLLMYVVATHAHGAGVPIYAGWILVTLFTLFVLTAGSLRAQFTGRAHSYNRTELTYMILGFLAKTAVAWQVFAGTLR